MFAAFVLLVMIGLGVFRFEIDPGAWPLNNPFPSRTTVSSADNPVLTPARTEITQIFVYNTAFWLTQLVTALLAILLPYLRPIRASLVTLATAMLILLINLPAGSVIIGIPLEFELITVLALFSLYILLSFIGEIRDRQQLTAIFSQYVPPELVEQFSRNPSSISLEGEAREVTVLFCDVYNFTTISEELDPKALAQWLNRYFSLISQIVVKHGGTLDKYIGDSVMAFWGAPVSSKTHASDALAAALDMQSDIAELSGKYKKEGLPAISIGIGISTGVGNVGNLGSQYRMAYTVVGDTVNMAQRLERQTRHYKVPIIASEMTVKETQGMLFRELDNIKVKGRAEFMRMFQPICSEENASPELLENLVAHKKAMTYLTNQDWKEAAQVFEALSESWSTDSVYEIYLKRINNLNHSHHSGV